jgi:hypothetical protein
MSRVRVDAWIWFTRIRAAHRSPLSARAYCERRGWPYSTFIAWRLRLCRELAGGPRLNLVKASRP